MRRFAVLSAATLTGRSSERDPGPVVDNGGAVDPVCPPHQANAPGARHTDEVMPLLRHHTADGRGPFRDAGPPTGDDRAWVEWRVRLGGERAHVANPLG